MQGFFFFLANTEILYRLLSVSVVICLPVKKKGVIFTYWKRLAQKKKWLKDLEIGNCRGKNKG